MEFVIIGLIVFVIIFLARLFIYMRSHKKKKKNTGIIMEMKYLITKFNLDDKKVDTKGTAALISLLDRLIITGTFIAVLLITDNIYIEMILGLALVVILIYVVYEIFGRILKKRGYEK